MNILVTGGGGYLGAVLLPKFITRGHSIRVVDIGYFGLGHLKRLHPAIEIVKDDLRRIATDAPFRDALFKDCDCVIHLAAISNDPSAELQPQLTREVNFEATVALAEVARERGVRFVFSSSCSVYGEAESELTEDDAVSPLTAYAKSKVQSEEALRAMATPDWRPVILRNGTLFGYSPRMRFDLVINIFALYSYLHGGVRVFGDGLQWRPFLSVHDCARAFVFFAEKASPRHLFYNIAHENLRVVDVASIFRAISPGLKVTHVPTEDPDRRDYHVCTARMREEGFQPRVGVMAGAEEIVEALVCGAIPDPESVFYRNAKWLKELSQIGRMDHRQVVGLMESFSVLGHGSGA